MSQPSASTNPAYNHTPNPWLYGGLVFPLDAPLPQGTAGLTPEGLMIYLRSRLGNLDSQIGDIFNKQQKNQATQKALEELQNTISKLDADTKTSKKYTGLGDELRKDLADLKKVDPDLASEVAAEIQKQGQVLYGGDDSYNGQEVTASQTYIDNLVKDIDSGSQMDMIHLQSLMSSRQTAVQLSTNLVSALGQSTRSIAANVGK